jgi:hypothetical protein
MKNESRDELLDTLTAALAVQLVDAECAPRDADLRAALDAATADWSVTRKDYPNTDQHPLEDDSYGHRLVLTGPFVPESDEETAERTAWEAARSWAWRAHQFSYDPQDLGYDDGECPPPPERVGATQLLNQGIWWRMRTERDPVDKFTSTEAIRLEDMTHDHRLALLAFLRRNAPRYKMRADWAMTSGPQPSGDAACDAFEAACDQQWETSAAEWIEDQPLVQALAYWTTPVAESPLTWRPMEEAPHDGTVIAARWENARPLDEPERIYWARSGGWYLMDRDGPLDDESAEVGFDGWRELRDDELPTPVEPFDPDGEHATWRPMNEAPTDGTEIMVRWANAGPLDEPERAHWVHAGTTTGYGWYTADDGPLSHEDFTGWRELRGYRDEV